jgi:acetyl-CoA C-acetyltransferase
MREVAVIGIGQTPIGEHWQKSLRHLAYDALRDAAADAGVDKPDALFVGNMLAERLSDQAHLGALIADFAGWRGVEASTVEAACASGGAAFSHAVRAVASGYIECAAVVGIEKMTDLVGPPVTNGLATASDAEYEQVHGITFVALNALLMQRYMYEFGVAHESFGAFTVNAHKNAVNNPNAMFRKAITINDYLKSSMIAPPINLMDSSPICDGAAAAILVPLDTARDLGIAKPIKVLASANAIDCLSLHDRRDLLHLDAAEASAQKAYAQAGITPQDVDLFEVHDAFSIMAALSLEASGFAERGCAPDMAREGTFAIGGDLPISTMGGLKARGHPVGATGMYEIIDVITQLRGDAGANQVQHAEIGMSQNIGGTGGTVVTHLFAPA